MDCVRPGVELVRANPFMPNKLLIKLDLPTFERPAKTTSGRLSFGNDSGDWAAAINFALTIFNALIATAATEPLRRREGGMEGKHIPMSIHLSISLSLFLSVSLSLCLCASVANSLDFIRSAGLRLSLPLAAFAARPGPAYRDWRRPGAMAVARGRFARPRPWSRRR